MKTKEKNKSGRFHTESEGEEGGGVSETVCKAFSAFPLISASVFFLSISVEPV